MRRFRLLRLLLLGAAIFIASAMGFYLIENPKYRFDVGSVSILNSDADLKIDRIHIVNNSSGTKDWEMWADSAKVYHKKKLTHLKNLKIRFYPKSGKPSYVSAERGVMKNEDRSMKISGNVIIRSPDGIIMKTKSLEFNPKKKQIETNERIFIEGKTFRLSGEGLNGNTESGQYILKRSVTAILDEIATNTLAAPSSASRPVSYRRGGGKKDTGRKP